MGCQKIITNLCDVINERFLMFFAKALRYKLYFVKALSKQLRKLTIKTKQLSQLKLLSFVNFNN